MIGHCLADLGEYDQSLNLYNKIREEFPGYAYIYAALGDFYKDSQFDFDKSLENYDISLKLKEDALTLEHRGNLFYGNNLLEKALKDFMRSKEIQGLTELLAIKITLCKRKLGNKDQ